MSFVLLGFVFFLTDFSPCPLTVLLFKSSEYFFLMILHSFFSLWVVAPLGLSCSCLILQVYLLDLGFSFFADKVAPNYTHKRVGPTLLKSCIVITSPTSWSKRSEWWIWSVLMLNSKENDFAKLTSCLKLHAFIHLGRSSVKYFGSCKVHLG